MFKQVISAAALIAASGALASAATTTVDVIDLLSQTTNNYSRTNNTSYNLAGYSESVTADDVTNVLGSKGTNCIVYYGFGNGSSSTSNAVFGTLLTYGDTDPETVTVSTYARPAYSGTWAAIYVTVSEITTDADLLDSFTYSYTETTGLTVTAWAIVDGTAQSIELSGTSGSFSVSTLGLDEDDSIVLLISNTGSSGGTTLSTTVSLVATVIPEPSTFGLLAGVGALAFVAARRRRSRKA